MKFTNTKVQAVEVKKDAVAWGKATWALTKSVSKMPVAIGKDISGGAKLFAQTCKELKARQAGEPATES